MLNLRLIILSHMIIFLKVMRIAFKQIKIIFLLYIIKITMVKSKQYSLITGCAGFIGFHLCLFFLKK